MMVDGIRLNNSIFRYGPNQYLNTVDAFGLDQMEVLFGNGAVQYGSDAMGGVILAKFHEPETKNLNRWVPHFLSGACLANKSVLPADPLIMRRPNLV